MFNRGSLIILLITSLIIPVFSIQGCDYTKNINKAIARPDIDATTFMEADFDNTTDADLKKFNLAADKIVSDGNNKVLRLFNETTEVIGNLLMTNYRIKGKVKLVRRMLDEGDYNTSFEVAVRRKQGNPGPGLGGYNFVYRIENSPSDNYMRIDTSPGPKLNIEDGSWHEFTAEILGRQMVFTIDEETQFFYIADDRFANGGFCIRAVNCEIYLDDIKVENFTTYTVPLNQAEKLELDANYISVCKYDILDISQITALRVVDGNGRSRYISFQDNVRWEIIEGGKYAELIQEETLRFNPGTKNNTKIVVRAVFMNPFTGQELAADLTLIAREPGISEEDYVRAGTKKRQESLLRRLAFTYDLKPDILNQGINHMQYIFGQLALYPEEKNYDEELKWLTELERGSENDRDFVVNQIIALYKILDGRINASENVWDDMIESIFEFPFYSSYEIGRSENHMLTLHVGGLLTCENWPDAVMFNGKTGRENLEKYKQDLKDWMSLRMRKGLKEFDSGYTGIDYFYLSFLKTYTKDEKIAKAADNTLEYLFADMAVDSIDGIAGGAHGRTYTHFTDIMSGIASIFQIFFDNSIQRVDKNTRSYTCQLAPMTISDYRPSDVVMKIARDRNKRFNNKEKRMVYMIPDDETVTETLKKYTHVTPEYVLGSVVQTDIAVGNADKYTIKGGRYYKLPGALPGGTWLLQGHQELNWSLYIGKTMGSYIFDTHPGPGGVKETGEKHAYFTGDYNCLCAKYWQNENTMVGMHKIGKDRVLKRDELKFTHFWIPKSEFEIIDEEDGWIFVKHLNTYVAIKPLKDGVVSNEKQYSWGQPGGNYDATKMPLSNLEVKVESADTAFVLQVADTTEFKGTFEKFKEKVKTLPINYKIDGDNYFIEFTGLNGNKIKLDYNSDKRYLNGKEVDIESYELQDSPYLQADWNKGEITFKHGKLKKTISIKELEF